LVCGYKKYFTADGILGDSMGLFDRFKTVDNYQVPQYIPNTLNRDINGTVIPPARDSVVVTDATALTLIPVSRAIAVLETAIMQIPVQVYRGSEVIESPLWLETPDIQNNISQAEWLGKTVLHMATTGNAFWKVTRGARGIANIEVVHPSFVSVNSDNKGNLYYTINTKKYTRNEVIHIKLFTKPLQTDHLGEGPIQRHKSLLRSALDLQAYADNWFRTSAIPTGTLTTTEFLSEDVAIANKKAFIESQRDRSVAVLSSGLSYETISLNPEEAQFLENQKYITRQIAVAFGVPTLYMGMGIEGQGMTYVNGNEDRAKLFEDGLQQYIVRIQQAITDLLPRGQRAKFNLTEFLRPNVKTRYESYAIALTNSFLTVNEVREMEGMPEMMTDAVTPEDVDMAPANARFKEGDMVTGPTADGEKTGTIEYIMWQGGTYGAVGTPFAIESLIPDNPAMSVKVYENGEATPYTIGMMYLDARLANQPTQ
jgi:HK97 family phage portal protein